MPNLISYIVNAMAPRHRAVIYFREFTEQDDSMRGLDLRNVVDIVDVERRIREFQVYKNRPPFL